jgi:hypothetical protein
MKTEAGKKGEKKQKAKETGQCSGEGGRQKIFFLEYSSVVPARPTRKGN